MYDDAADVLALAQPHVRPGSAAVLGLVDAIAPGCAALIVVFTGADPKDLRITRRDGDVADRCGSLMIEDWLPGRAAVRCLPHSTRCRRDVEKLTESLSDLRRSSLWNREINHSTTRDRRSNWSPRQFRETRRVGVEGCGSSLGDWCRLRVKRRRNRREEDDRERRSRASFEHCGGRGSGPDNLVRVSEFANSR